jgi:hypothetical protein
MRTTTLSLASGRAQGKKPGHGSAALIHVEKAGELSVHNCLPAIELTVITKTAITEIQQIVPADIDIQAYVGTATPLAGSGICEGASS